MQAATRNTVDPALVDDALRFPDHAQALGLLRTHSRLDAHAVEAGSRTPGPGLYRALDTGLDSPDRVQITAAPSPRTPLEQLQRERLSERFYADRPVAAEVIAGLVAAAGGFDEAAWPDREAGAGLQFLVAARAVTGLRPAIHLADPRSGRFTAIGELPIGAAAADLVLQLEFAQAPAILMVCGPLASSLDRHGEHGHRLLLSRAGAAAYAGWLTALDHGLAGSIFAGFLAAALRPLVPVDGYHTTQLLALAVGHPLDSTRD